MEKTIDECFFQIQNGANIKQGEADGGFPITRIETIANDKFNRDRMGYAGITDIGKYESFILEDGDLLMSHINSVQYLGRTVLYEKQENETIIHGMNLLRLKARKDIIVPAYARYCFYALPFRRQLAKIIKKSVNQASFAVTDLKKIKLKVPEIEEQSTVVDKLDKIRDIIDKRTEEIKQLDMLIKARFVEMFGNPIENDMHWDMDSLLGVLESGRSVTYGIVQTGDDVEGGVPVFRPIDFAGGHIPVRAELKKTLPEISDKYRRTLLAGNELLITVRGTVGDTFQVSKEFEGCNVGRNIVPLVTDKTKIAQRFLQELFAQKRIKDWLKSITKGIALQGLNMGEFKDMPVIVPPMELQKQYVNFCKQVDKSKVA